MKEYNKDWQLEGKHKKKNKGERFVPKPLQGEVIYSCDQAGLESGKAYLTLEGRTVKVVPDETVLVAVPPGRANRGKPVDGCLFIADSKSQSFLAVTYDVENGMMVKGPFRYRVE